MSLTQGDPLPNINTTQNQVTSAPSWYTDYLSGLASGAATGSTNAQYAGAQPLQTAAFNQVQQNVGNYQPTLSTATNIATGVGQGDVTKRVGDFMNPYTTQVVDALGQLGQRNIQQFLAPQATASAVGTGQFGSKRGAEVLGQAINTGLQNTQNAQTQALQQGYAEALRAAQAEQGVQLGAAQQLGALGQQQQTAGLADVNALATLGGQQQTIKQNEQLFPLTALNMGAQALRGYNVPTSVSNTYNGPIPGAYAASPLAQIAGLGAIIGGISNTKFGSATGDWLSKLFTGGSGGSNLSNKDIEDLINGGGGSGGSYTGDPGYQPPELGDSGYTPPP
jgi:hypothetical protein